jgi:Crp-like helix-turn-helix domain
VTALDDATLLFVSKQDFQSLCLTHPQVSLKVLRVVGARLRRLVGIIEELSFTTVRHRLAAFLVRLAKTSGERATDGIEIKLPANNQELASQIGTVRELVSRNLSRFQAEGMLKIDGRNVTVTNLTALEAELESGEWSPLHVFSCRDISHRDTLRAWLLSESHEITANKEKSDDGDHGKDGTRSGGGKSRRDQSFRTIWH